MIQHTTGGKTLSNVFKKLATKFYMWAFKLKPIAKNKNTKTVKKETQQTNG